MVDASAPARHAPISFSLNVWLNESAKYPYKLFAQILSELNLNETMKSKKQKPTITEKKTLIRKLE